MQFMFLVISAENQGNPPQALYEAMDKHIAKAKADGSLVITGGLESSAQATRVAVANRNVTVKDGPYSEAKEMVGGFAIMKFDTREQAAQAAKDFLQLHADTWPEWKGEVEMRQIFMPEDF
ncbi:MAG: hypothetical protein JOZ39_12390 [Chloroflexi bacterium]|nr:hypothetical protein [Chloroflexota bacterium]